jgi:hypothetical protein
MLSLWKKDGPVDILVGIDKPMLHIGETRQQGDFVARHSPLGWVLFGTTQGANEVTNQVFNIKTTVLPTVDIVEHRVNGSISKSMFLCK